MSTIPAPGTVLNPAELALRGDRSSENVKDGDAMKGMVALQKLLGSRGPL